MRLPQFIADNPQIIVVIVAAIVVTLGKLWDKVKPKAEGDYRPSPPVIPQRRERQLPPSLPQRRQSTPPPMPSPAPVAGADDELYRRRLLEERRKLLEERDAGEEMHRQRLLEERARLLKEKERAERAEKAARRKKAKAAPIAVTPSRLQDTLRNPRELRKAVITREILGPPVGLR